MNWISIKDKLPEFRKHVLAWALVGHRYGYKIVTLVDTNGPKGYIECVGAGGITCQLPNKEYPDNLEWNIKGHWYAFEKVTHWAELLKEPIIDK